MRSIIGYRPRPRRQQSPVHSTSRDRRSLRSAPIWQGEAPGIPCFIQGKVSDFEGKPIGNVELDIWQTDGEGLYEAQVEGEEGYMRGIYHSRPDGTYLIETVAPIGYTIPLDGTVGELFSHTSISPYRPCAYPLHVDVPRAITK